MENLSPEEALLDTKDEEVPAPENETNETLNESVEPKIDHWEMVKIMRKFGFTDINEHPGITKEMRDQNHMYAIDRNDRNETITIIWKDGYCWARKGSAILIEKIEAEMGRSLHKGALYPNNLVFEHTDME